MGTANFNVNVVLSLRYAYIAPEKSQVSELHKSKIPLPILLVSIDILGGLAKLSTRAGLGIWRNQLFFGMGRQRRSLHPGGRKYGHRCQSSSATHSSNCAARGFEPLSHRANSIRYRRRVFEAR